jgi:hypothetical protein
VRKITIENSWIPFKLVATVLNKQLSNIVYVPESTGKGIQVGLHLQIQQYDNYYTTSKYWYEDQLL